MGQQRTRVGTDVVQNLRTVQIETKFLQTRFPKPFTIEEVIALRKCIDIFQSALCIVRLCAVNPKT